MIESELRVASFVKIRFEEQGDEFVQANELSISGVWKIQKKNVVQS